jgi:hypothetical protein
VDFKKDEEGKNMEFPRYMEKGSTGVLPNMLLAGLAVWVRWYQSGGQIAPDEQITCDGMLGTVGMMWLNRWQERTLNPDGGFGPDSRRVWKEMYGIDFEEIARTAGGESVLVQLDGSKVRLSGTGEVIETEVIETIPAPATQSQSA